MAKQLKLSVHLSEKEREKFDKLDNSIGMSTICTVTGLKKSTYYNLLNFGHGREDNVDAVRNFMKLHKVK